MSDKMGNELAEKYQKVKELILDGMAPGDALSDTGMPQASYYRLKAEDPNSAKASVRKKRTPILRRNSPMTVYDKYVQTKKLILSKGLSITEACKENKLGLASFYLYQKNQNDKSGMFSRRRPKVTSRTVNKLVPSQQPFIDFQPIEIEVKDEPQPNPTKPDRVMIVVCQSSQIADIMESLR